MSAYNIRMPAVAGQPAIVYYLLKDSSHDRALNQINLDPATGDRVYLAVVHEPGQPPHLRTRLNGAWTDHLLALAPCGLTEHLIA